MLDNPYDVGYEGDGKVLKPGATFGNGIFEDSIEDKQKINACTGLVLYQVLELLLHKKLQDEWKNLSMTR